jgi:CheY-like chemotaxis protein
VTDKKDRFEGEIISPVRFKNIQVELPVFSRDLKNEGHIVERAINHTRSMLLDFMQEVDPDNPVSGKILDELAGGKPVEKPLSEAKIYVVDDDPLVANSMKRPFRGNYQNISVFGDGEEALDAMYKDGKLVEVPHLVISDTNMKRIHGPELARKLQDLDAAIRPRFVAMTGKFQSANIREYVEMGLSVLGKPFYPGVLLALSTQELRQHPGFRPSLQAGREGEGSPEGSS